MTPTPRVYTPIDSTRFMPGTPVHRWLTHLDEICHQAHLDLVAAPLSLALLDATLRAWAANKTHHNEIDRIGRHGFPLDKAAFLLPAASEDAVPRQQYFATLKRLIGYGWLVNPIVNPTPYRPSRRYVARIGQPYGEPR